MSAIRKLLLAAAVCLGIVAAARMLFGPFTVLIPVNTPVNVEGLLALALTVLLVVRKSTTAAPAAAHNRLDPSKSSYVRATLAAGVALVALAGLGRALRIGFLSDDFILVKLAEVWTPDRLLPAFSNGGGDGFFRPIGYLQMALDARWAGLHPALWHAGALTLHILNSILVMLLAWRTGASRLAGFVAAAVFAIHGTRPEAAVWIAGRFDLLATGFLLAALLLFPRAKLLALACFVLAVLSKESAYVLPLLLLLYIPRWRAALPFWIAAAALFVYRWTLFGGIGGYPFSLGLGSTLKAVGVRLWTALYFPLNWSREPSAILALAGLAYITCLIWMVARTQPAARLWLPVGFILIAVIPALPLLAIGSQLANSRVLYLPSVGFCILLALALDGLPPRSRIAAAAVVLVFHFIALQHNLTSWEFASAQVNSTCAGPDQIEGVPALANGRKECLEWNAPK